MNVLPKDYKEFLSKNYWDKFFRKLKNKKDLEFFEWYGNFKNFQPVLEKLLLPTDTILNIGCGKSLFSEDLHDNGFKNILNMDYSEEVVKEMQARSEKIRPTMKYEVMDIFNMTYQTKQFDVILDKGALDAVCPENQPEIIQNVKKMLKDISNIAKKRYLCISLLQDHVLETLLQTYYGQEQQQQKQNCKIVIYETLIEQSKLFPFLVDVQFNPEQQQSVNAQQQQQQQQAQEEVKEGEKVNVQQKFQIELYLKGKKEPIFLTKEQCVQQIRQIQLQNCFMNSIKKLQSAQRVSIDVWDTKNINSLTPKFSLYIVDSDQKKILEKKTCGCFITPQGKENGWLASTDKGNRELLQQSGFSRLIIAIINPGHSFSSLQQVQDELSPAILDILPKDCNNTPCPFLTDGDELGQKIVIMQDNQIIIEECLVDDQAYRRLILKDNLCQIQSQFRLTYYNHKNQEKQKLVQLNKILKSVLPEKKSMLIGIDESYLDFEAYQAIIAGLSIIPIEVMQKQKVNTLILGGGLCSLSKFLRWHFSNMQVTSIEISKTIIEFAKKYFEVDEEDTDLKLICQDALVYVDELCNKIVSQKKEQANLNEQKDIQPQQKQQQEEAQIKQQQQQEETKESSIIVDPGKQDKQDIVIIDINGKDGETSPPKPFLEPQFIEKIQKILVQNTGMLIINVMSHQEKETESIIAMLSKYFEVIYSSKMENEINEVIYAVNVQLKHEKKQEEDIVIVEQQQIKNKKDLDSNFKALCKGLKKQWDQTLNIDQFTSTIKLRWPKVYSSPFERTNVHLDNEEKIVNSTKEMYQNDLNKVNRNKKQRKKKNK